MEKNIPRRRFKEFVGSGDWEEKKLGEVGSVSMNKRIFKHQTSEQGDIPFYKIGTFGKDPDAFISRKLFEEYKNKYSYPEKGDILISASGSIGRTVVYKGEDEYFQDSNIVWLNHQGKLNNLFLKQFYRVVKWEGLEGSTIKRLYNKNILETNIVLPSLAEQEKIGNFFQKLDRLIDINREKLGKLKASKSAYLTEMFPREGEDRPRRRFQGFTGDWQEDKAKDICSISTGKSNTQDRNSDGKYPFYVRSSRIECSTKYLYNEEAVLTVGDGVGTGKVFHYVNGKYDLHQRVYRMFNFNNIMAKYFYYYFSVKFYDRVMSMTARTSVDSVRYEMISEMNILYPSMEEQIKIVKLLETFDQQIEVQEKKLEKLEKMKKAYLAEMFV